MLNRLWMYKVSGVGGKDNPSRAAAAKESAEPAGSKSVAGTPNI